MEEGVRSDPEESHAATSLIKHSRRIQEEAAAEVAVEEEELEVTPDAEEEAEKVL